MVTAVVFTPGGCLASSQVLGGQGPLIYPSVYTVPFCLPLSAPNSGMSSVRLGAVGWWLGSSARRLVETLLRRVAGGISSSASFGEVRGRVVSLTRSSAIKGLSRGCKGLVSCRSPVRRFRRLSGAREIPHLTGDGVWTWPDAAGLGIGERARGGEKECGILMGLCFGMGFV